jgi:hypothetical protein
MLFGTPLRYFPSFLFIHSKRPFDFFSFCPFRLRLGWYQALCIHWSAIIHQYYVRVAIPMIAELIRSCLPFVVLGITFHFVYIQFPSLKSQIFSLVSNLNLCQFISCVSAVTAIRLCIKFPRNWISLLMSSLFSFLHGFLGIFMFARTFFLARFSFRLT